MVGVAIASCHVDMKQEQLVAMEIKKQSSEKPRFLQLDKSMWKIKLEI